MDGWFPCHELQQVLVEFRKGSFRESTVIYTLLVPEQVLLEDEIDGQQFDIWTLNNLYAEAENLASQSYPEAIWLV